MVLVVNKKTFEEQENENSTFDHSRQSASHLFPNLVAESPCAHLPCMISEINQVEHQLLLEIH